MGQGYARGASWLPERGFPPYVVDSIVLPQLSQLAQTPLPVSR